MNLDLFSTMSKAELINGDDSQPSRHRLRDERKRILKICINKLQRIQDPESVLCRSVLINNTLRSIQEEHRESQKKVRLKRQKESYCEEFDSKRMCLEEPVREEEEDADDEEDIEADDVTGDVTSPLCAAYYDVQTYQEDTLDDVILCDQTDTSNDIDVWCDEELEQEEGEEGSEEIEDDEDISNSSVDFSISALSYKHTPRSPHTFENNNEFTRTPTVSGSGDYPGSSQCGDAFPNSLIHSSSISLKS